MSKPVSNAAIPHPNNPAQGQFKQQQNNSNARIDSLPRLALAQIFEFASRNQEGFETTAAIRATSRNWQNINDGTLLPNLYYHVKTALGNHPFFQTIPAFNAIMNATPEQMKSSALFKDLSRAFNAPCLLFPEQYLTAYQQLEDTSLVTIWGRIAEQINFQNEPIPREAQEIRDWINNPENAQRIQAITALNLSNMNLQWLPQEVGAFVNLQILNLSDNRLESLPQTIGNLLQLQNLNLTNNQLRSLPATWENLNELKMLNLQNNQLTSLPETFGNLQQLQTLSLAYNQLTSLPETFGNLQQLQHLNLTNNRLARLPDSFGNLQQLQILSLAYNRLESLPQTIGNLLQLQWLYLNNNRLESLPQTIGNSLRLQHLNLDNNRLESLPQTIGNLLQLQHLNLDNNRLVSIPETFGNLQQLRWLYLNNNRLVSIPETFGNLQQLRRLYLNSNHLVSIPETFGNLQQLERLYLNNNRLVSIPETFGNLQQLQFLHLNGHLFLFMLDKEFSNFNSSISFTFGFSTVSITMEKHRACRQYEPKTPFARLCQLIHNQSDNNLLEPALRCIPRAIQNKIRSKIEDIWASLPEHQEVENKDLLRADAVRAACHERVEVLNQAIIEVLRETSADLTPEQKLRTHDHVWNLAGRPEGDSNWGENHAEDNIIRLIDAMALVCEEEIGSSS